MPVTYDLLNLFGSLFLLFVILGYILDLGAILFLSLLVRVFVLIVLLDFLIISNKNYIFNNASTLPRSLGL